MSEIMEDTANAANAAFSENSANCSNLTNGCGTVDVMEKFIEVIRPLLTMPEERKESSFDKLRAAVAQRVADNPKFRERPFYKGLFEELLHTVEAHNYSNANTLIKEAIEELKYNVDCRPKLDNKKEVKLRAKNIKKLKSKYWKLHKKAQRYMEKEIDLNAEDFEEDNSAFMKHQRIARRILKLKKQINELQNKPLRTGSSNEKKYTFNGSEYTQINEAITNLVNDMLVESHKVKSDQKLRLLAAPDLATVHEVIVKVAEANKLCLYDIEDYSKKMLRKVGEDLKARRRMETEYSFESYLRLDAIKPETVVPEEEEALLEPTFREHGQQAVLETENIIRQFEEQENANGVQTESSETGRQEEVNNGELKDDEMKDDEEEDESGSSDSESDLDDEKENEEEESSSEEEEVDDSDDEIQIIDVKDASTVQSADA